MISLAVFDLDGTLIDSRQDLADATNAMLKEYGAPPLGVEEVTAMVGEGAAVLVARALESAGLARGTPGALDRFLAQYARRLTAHTCPYPGIPGALADLRQRGITLGVLTNKPQQATTAILEQLGLAPHFSFVVGGDTPAGRKPHTAGLQSIISRAGGTATATVLVGDSPIDLETARRAGTRICLARYGFGFRFGEDAFHGDELFLDDPSGIVSVLTDES